MSGIIEMLTADLEVYKTSFFSSHSVSGTAISGATTPTTDPPAATEGLLSIYNSASRTTTNGQNTIIVPLYIRIKIDTVGAAGTASKFILAKDTIERYSSGGTKLTTNQTRAGSNAAGAVDPITAWGEIYGGALTLAAASASKQVGRADVRPSGTSFIAGDQIIILFGDNEQAGGYVTTAAKFVTGVTPVFLEPGTSLILQSVITSQTGLSKFDFEVGHVEIKKGSGA